MNPNDCARVLRGLYDSFNIKDNDRLDAVAVHGAWIELRPFESRVGLREAWQNWATAFPDAQVEIIRLDAGMHRASAEIIGRGTHKGDLVVPFGRLRPTHRTVELHLVESYEFDEDEQMIAWGVSDFDAASLFRQLGIVPPPKEPRFEPEVVEPNWGY